MNPNTHMFDSSSLAHLFGLDLSFLASFGYLLLCGVVWVIVWEVQEEWKRRYAN